MIKVRFYSILIVALLLGGCGSWDQLVTKTGELVADTKAMVKKHLPSDKLQWPVGSDVEQWRLDEKASEVVIRVYREGRLAKFGHNHVIEARGLKGRAAITPGFDDSGFELQSALKDWIVDSPELRRRSGKDFASEPSQSDIESTRRNMLGEKGLDATRFPVLSISGNVRDEKDAQMLDAHVSLHGKLLELEIPVSLVKSSQQVRVLGKFSVNQSDFGIEPMSLMFGALRVRDQVDIEFDLVLLK